VSNPTEIHARWLYTGLPGAKVLEHQTLCIDEEGRISAIVNSADAPKNSDAEQVHLNNHLLMPGLINCHGHSAMTLLRGYADDLALMPWLQDHIWPTEGRWVDADFVYDGVNLAMAEMIKTGTTTFSDQYFFPDATAKAASEAGMRCQVNFPVINVPTQWAQTPNEYISKGLQVRERYKNSALVSVIFGPHAPYSLDEPTLQRIRTLSHELDMGVQMHVQETKTEVLHAVELTGERPISTLDRLGLLDPTMQCVHMTSLSKDDIARVARSGAHVIHCPSSNMKLASGACPVTSLLNAGINVALGTDGAASNNGLNLFAEARLAALLAKLTAEDPAALPADQVLFMATLGGARALGLEHETGSLEAGKWADCIAINFDSAPMQPVYNPLSQVVYAGHGAHVDQSWIAGRLVLKDGKLTTLDETAVLERAAQWRDKIAAQHLN